MAAAPIRRTNPRLNTPVPVSDAFARQFYAARLAGEQLRAVAMEMLYQHPRLGPPGGRHPDPRGASAFSWWSMIQAAAWHLGVELDETTHPVPPPPAACWLLVYPAIGQMTIAHHPVPDEPIFLLRFCFDLAQLLGDIVHHGDMLRDPDFPAGPYQSARDRGTIACLHQFAIAFLGPPLGPSCPPGWDCDCNAIRARFNAAPPEHAQPTDALHLEAIHKHLSYREKVRPVMPPRKLEE